MKKTWRVVFGSKLNSATSGGGLSLVLDQIVSLLMNTRIMQEKPIGFLSMGYGYGGLFLRSKNIMINFLS